MARQGTVAMVTPRGEPVWKPGARRAIDLAHSRMCCERRVMERMAHWTNWLELGSWGAAIAGTVIAVISAVQASNAYRMKATLEMAMPFVRVAALSLDKPDILTAYESELTTARDILRKKTRRNLAVAGLAVSVPALSVGMGLLIPQFTSPTEIRFSAGDAARQECATTGLNWAMKTTCTNRWILAPGRKIQAQAALGSGTPEELDVLVEGCAQVRWELLADGDSLGSGVADPGHQERELNVPIKGTSSLTIRAERIDGDSCSAQFVVKAVVWP